MELFNRGSTPVSRIGCSIQYASATGVGTFASTPVTPLSGTLAPGQSYLMHLTSTGAASVVSDSGPGSLAHRTLSVGASRCRWRAIRMAPGALSTKELGHQTHHASDRSVREISPWLEGLGRS